MTLCSSGGWASPKPKMSKWLQHVGREPGNKKQLHKNKKNTSFIDHVKVEYGRNELLFCWHGLHGFTLLTEKPLESEVFLREAERESEWTSHEIRGMRVTIDDYLMP